MEWERERKEEKGKREERAKRKGRGKRGKMERKRGKEEGGKRVSGFEIRIYSVFDFLKKVSFFIVLRGNFNFF